MIHYFKFCYYFWCKTGRFVGFDQQKSQQILWEPIVKYNDSATEAGSESAYTFEGNIQSFVVHPYINKKRQW